MRVRAERPEAAEQMARRLLPIGPAHFAGLSLVNRMVTLIRLQKIKGQNRAYTYGHRARIHSEITTKPSGMIPIEPEFLTLGLA
jgi:hypothetical protein